MKCWPPNASMVFAVHLGGFLTKHYGRRGPSSGGTKLCCKMLTGTFLLNHVRRSFHTTTIQNHIIKLTRLRVVDNSEIGKLAMAEGKPPKCIHIYNKQGVGSVGDKVLVAIKGQKKKGILVGCKKHQKSCIPKFDSNNIVLIDDNGTPLGTRIHVPIPHVLRTILKEKNIAKGVDYTKLLALATKFV